MGRRRLPPRQGRGEVHRRRLVPDRRRRPIDSRGCIRICDRSKDLVKSGGEWISSVDLENR